MKRVNGNGGTTVAAPPLETREKRMTMQGIVKSKPSESEKIVLYGPEGWGKTTWASQSENPVFLSTEDGLKHIKVDTFPEPKNWLDVFDAVQTLREQDHDFKTLVLDTADWTEHLCHAYILARDKKDSIEDYGYGKGYVIAFEEWKKLLVPIDALRREKKMNIIFLGHSMVKTFNNPAGENFDRYEMKLDRRVASLLKEWSDCILFGNYEIAVDQKKGYGGDRILYTNHSPAWDAKNRYGLTKPLPSDYSAFSKAVKEARS